MADEVREERVDRLVGDPAALRGRDQGEADLGDATLLVDPDVDIADEFAKFMTDADASMASAMKAAW